MKKVENGKTPDVKEVALSIAKCENYQNEVCKGFIKYHDREGCRQIPEPWNGDIEKADILVISSNPSYDKNEKYPAYGDSDDDIYNFFKNRFAGASGKSFRQVRFWNTINKWAHWIEAIENGDTDADSIIKKHKKRAAESAYDRICITEVCHCKSVKQKYVGKYVSVCVEKYLRSVLECYKGKYIIVTGVVANRYIKEIEAYKNADSIIITTDHPCATRQSDEARVKNFIKNSLMI